MLVTACPVRAMNTVNLWIIWYIDSDSTLLVLIPFLNQNWLCRLNLACGLAVLFILSAVRLRAIFDLEMELIVLIKGKGLQKISFGTHSTSLFKQPSLITATILHLRLCKVELLTPDEAGGLP